MQVRLISEVDSIADFETFEAGLEMRMDEGWHSYWRTPGDSGLPPRFDWTGSENVENVHVLYPVPRRFDEYGLYTFGYSGAVTFPLTVNLKEKGKPAILKLKLETMVCKDICIPQTLETNLDIPKGIGADSSDAALVRFAQDKVPHWGNTKYLSMETAVASKEMLAVSMMAEEKLTNAQKSDINIFIEVKTEDRGVVALTAAPEIEINQDHARRAILKVSKPSDIESLDEFLSGKRVTITLVNGRRAVENTLQF